MDPTIDVKMAVFVNELCKILLDDFSAHDQFYEDQRTKKIIYLLYKSGFISIRGDKLRVDIGEEIKNILEKWRTHAD